MLVHGESGVGKSWLADTAPAPRLILDAEGRAKYTPSSPKVSWDPMKSGPPAYDGSWETCVVNVLDFNVMDLVYQWLRSGQHPFTSVVIDSLMEVQKRCIDNLVGINPLDQQDWGTLLRKLDALVRSYRDLTLLENPASVIIFITGSTQRGSSEKWVPMLQGSLRDTLAYSLDVVGYYYVRVTESGPQRELLVDKLPGFEAKDGTGKLNGPIIVSPNIEEMVKLLHVQGKAEVTTTEVSA